MPDRAPVPFRGAITAMADLLATPDGRRLLRLLGYASRTSAPDADEVFAALVREPLPDLATRRDARIGIWTQDAEDPSTFVRRQHLEPTELWAEVDRIPPRRPGRRRIVLLGESVARGFFHDPHFNPAIALQRMLASTLGDEVEVIDLARVDIGMLALLRLAKVARLLDPDAVVIWAGNNWHPAWAFTDGRLPEVGLRLRADRDWQAMKRLMDETLRRHVTLGTATLASLLPRDRPVLFLIPEFNLGDWRDLSTAPALLTASETARWLDARDEAPDALARGDLARATALGEQLLAIDHGSTPIGYYVLADVRRLAGDIAGARRLLRQSRDVSLWWPRSFSPTTYGVVRQHLADAGPGYGWTIVDLPRELEAWCGDSLPDRRLFHDYCHLTADGIRVCVARAAARLIPALGGPACSADQLAAIDHAVGSDVLAGANLLAAVFNANNGQSRALVRHHFDAMVRHGGAARSLLACFLEVHVRRAPALLCEALERLLTTVRITGFHLLHGLGRRVEDKTLNLLLIEEGLRALRQLDPDAPASLERLLVAEHGLAARPVNLLEATYAPAPFIRQSYRGRLGIYQALDTTSTFVVISPASQPIRIALTARVAAASGSRALTLAINGTTIATCAVASDWRSESIVVAAEHVRAGANEIVIRWPAPSWDREAWIDATADSFERHTAPEISPVFGQIASCRVTADVSAAAQPDAGARDTSTVASSIAAAL
jgi:hypothetical protein